MRVTVIAACCIAMLFTSLPALVHAQQPAPTTPPHPVQYPVFQTIKTGERYAFALSFSPNGSVLAVADGSAVHFYDPRTGKSVREPWECADGAYNFLFVDAKTVAIVGDLENAVNVREYPSGKTLNSWKLEKGQYVAAIARAEGMVAVGSKGPHRYVHLLTAPHWREAWKTDQTDQEKIRAMTISPDKSEVAVGGWGSEIRVYATKDGKLLRRAGQKQYVLPATAGLSYSPDSRQIAFGPSTTGVTISNTQFTQSRDIRWSNPDRAGCQPVGCQFTPDGKTLLVPTEAGEVRLYELATGRLRRIGLIAMPPRRFALSPNGRFFAVAGHQPDVSVVDWRAAEGRRSAEWFRKSLWDDLASPDSEKGYWAVVALGYNTTQATELIGEKLKPVPAPNAAAVKAWIVKLSSEDFAQRETAEMELAKLGDTIEPQLREAAKSEVPERRDRAIRLLTACTRATDPNRLRILRAVEVLEYINTPASRDVLKTLASGAPGVLLTRDAKAALERLQAFAPKP